MLVEISHHINKKKIKTLLGFCLYLIKCCSQNARKVAYLYKVVHNTGFREFCDVESHIIA